MGGILQIVRFDLCREWTVSSRPARSQRAVSDPLRVESLSASSSFYKQVFPSGRLADN